jgi:hypothetical protein
VAFTEVKLQSHPVLSSVQQQMAAAMSTARGV